MMGRWAWSVVRVGAIIQAFGSFSFTRAPRPPSKLGPL